MHVYARVESPGFALGVVAFVPFLAALDRVRSARAALALGWLFSVAFVFGVFSWFGTGMALYASQPAVVGLAVLALVAPLLQPQLLVYALARWSAAGPVAAPRRARAALAGAFAYVGAEWALPKLFGDTLGHGLLAAPLLRQGAELAGAGGLTLVLLLCNECVLAALGGLGAPASRLRRTLVPAGCAALGIAALAGYGALRLRSLEAELALAERVRVGAVQAGIARYGELRREVGSFDAVASILDAHFELSGDAFARGPLDLLLWPETVYPTTFGAPKSEAGAAFDELIGRLVLASGVPLVFGAYDAEAGAEYNAAVFLERDGDGRVGFDTYRKAALFPLTERVPGWLAPLRRLLPWLGDWTPGGGARVIPVELRRGGSLRAAPLICYDAVDPRLAREAVRAGAELLVTLSNDSWFPGGAHLHLAVSAFRSIETRRAQARVTNTGISALILPTGEITARAGTGERTVLVGELPLVRDAMTPALALGDWLGPTAAVLALLGAFRWRRRGARGELG